ncbi:hypothetical protein [Rhodospira trueperi]|uniref:Uncharacterized protein n=1 Tax=Rhodospira trueperi TaxID=69960 RepID=A0A1G7GWQ9_9PROT|nr:hypothetical protein [Rhodospira trueperi]SDE92551.1 hypothetical protein SAMN05421720_11633 [Rhodospira trueperi]
MTEHREMYHEIQTLLGHLAAALALPSEQVAALLESGDLTLSLETDADGRPYIAAEYGEGDDRRTARVYRDAALRARTDTDANA